jgi:hypothetical protein
MGMPLHNDDKIRLHAKPPAALYVSFFRINGNGSLTHLEDFDPAKYSHLVYYPSLSEKEFPLKDPAGTEFFLVVGQRSGPVDANELRQLWDEREHWPRLTVQPPLRMDRDKVDWVERTKGGPEPHDQLQERLEAFRLRLREHFEYVEGLAFGHAR